MSTLTLNPIIQEALKKRKIEHRVMIRKDEIKAAPVKKQAPRKTPQEQFYTSIYWANLYDPTTRIKL